MTKLKNNRFMGFTVGIRIADAFALTVDPADKNAVAGLHVIKNIVNTMGLQKELKAIGINHNLYVGEEK